MNLDLDLDIWIASMQAEYFRGLPEVFLEIISKSYWVLVLQEPLQANQELTTEVTVSLSITSISGKSFMKMAVKPLSGWN